MTLSMNGRAALSFAGGLRFDLSTAGVEPPPVVARRHAWTKPLRKSLGLRGPVHALLVDAHGVWAWSPHDSYAAASRHGGVPGWIESHAGCDMRLWVSSDLMHSLHPAGATIHQGEQTLRHQARQELVARHGDGASAWPLATWKSDAALGVFALSGIDLEQLRTHALRHDVRMQSVIPWWHHAFLEAKRCVGALSHIDSGRVCVVEGRQIAWIATSHGELRDVQQHTLDTADVDCLLATTQRLNASASHRPTATVVLGQGLSGGGDTRAIDGLVLGRLDGHQPPQWLRPTTQVDMH